MSGDPYKGAERTAGVRATQIYYIAWTGTVHMKCWHFGSMNLVYATKTNAPHWEKRLLNVAMCLFAAIPVQNIHQVELLWALSSMSYDYRLVWLRPSTDT